MSLASGEFTAADYQKKTSGKKSDKDGGGGFILVILIIIVLVSIFKGGRGGGYSSRGSLPFWLAMGLLGSGNRGGVRLAVSPAEVWLWRRRRRFWRLRWW